MEGREDSLTAEKRMLGRSHTEVGGLLAAQWSFPKALAMAVRHHHRPVADPEHGTLCAIVYLADLLMSRFHCGLEIERLETRDLTAHLALLGLALDDFAGLVDAIPTSIFTSPELT